MQKLLDSRKLQEGASLGITHDHQQFILIRKDNRAYGYINRCPHLGINLEFQPNVFLDAGGEYIQCSSHGALFEIKDGSCIWGPCSGQALQKASIQEFDGAIWLK